MPFLICNVDGPAVQTWQHTFWDQLSLRSSDSSSLLQTRPHRARAGDWVRTHPDEALSNPGAPPGKALLVRLSAELEGDEKHKL